MNINKNNIKMGKWGNERKKSSKSANSTMLVS